MSNDDITMVELTLQGLMVPDNTLRREAEVKLEELMTSNRTGLVICLSNNIIGRVYLFIKKLLLKNLNLFYLIYFSFPKQQN